MSIDHDYLNQYKDISIQNQPPEKTLKIKEQKQKKHLMYFM